ncbi:MAG TPA: hypothetical protein PKK26_03920 [Candidatus Wallbacteria bacterium]|nr:hypothetical protein [Candidatus Wallbacteria bacterium]
MMKKTRFLKHNFIYKNEGLRLITFEKAFAIPLVILFSVVIMIFAFMLISSNVQSKKQRSSTLLTTKANFMAQGGLQHFKLKYKLMPQLMFDCGRLYMGFSPAYNLPDQFDNINQSGTSYPQYLARFIEDVTTGYDTATVALETPAGAPSLVDVNNITGSKNSDNINKKGGFKTMPLALGGFQMTDAQANEDFTEWGYLPQSIKNGSLRRGSENGKNFMEQSITIEMIGRAKNNVGGQSPGESKYRTHTVRETILVRKYTN